MAGGGGQLLWGWVVGVMMTSVCQAQVSKPKVA